MHHAGRPTTPERFLSCRGTDIHLRRCSWPVSNHNACTIILQMPLRCQLPAQLCTCPRSAVCTVTAATEAAPILPSAKHTLSCQCVCTYRLPAIQRYLHRAVLHLCQRVGPQGLHHLLHPLHCLHHPHHSHSLHHHCPHLLPASSRGPQMVVAFIHVWRVYRSAALHCVLHIAYALCMMLHAPLHLPWLDMFAPMHLLAETIDQDEIQSPYVCHCRHVHIRVLLLLLLGAVRHVRLHADILLLLLHVHGLLCVFLDAGRRGLQVLPQLCTAYIQVSAVIMLSGCYTMSGCNRGIQSDDVSYVPDACHVSL